MTFVSYSLRAIERRDIQEGMWISVAGSDWAEQVRRIEINEGTRLTLGMGTIWFQPRRIWLREDMTTNSEGEKTLGRSIPITPNDYFLEVVLKPLPADTLLNTDYSEIEKRVIANLGLGPEFVIEDDESTFGTGDSDGAFYSAVSKALEDAQPTQGDDLNPKDRAALNRAPLGLLPAVGSLYGAAAAADGARKYGPYNWREKPISYDGYLEAMERHIKSLREGEDIAQDSLVHHLGHIIATASILLDAWHTGNLINDRKAAADGYIFDLFEAFKDPEDRALHGLGRAA